MCEARKAMTGCCSESACGLKTALSLSWQGTVVFKADSGHLQRLMCSWATEALGLNQELHII